MLETYQKILSLLDRREKRRFYILVVMVLIMGLMEATGVASILPFLAVLSNPGIVQTNTYLNAVYQALGFANEQDFLMAFGVAVFVVIIVGLAFKTMTMYALTKFSQMQSYAVGCRLLERYLGQRYEWYLTRHSSHLTKTVLSEVDEVVRTALLPGARLIGYSAIASFLMALLVVVDPVVALVATCVLGGSYSLIFMMSRSYLGRLGVDRVRANKERYQIVQECFGGIKHVKLRGLEEESLRRFRGPARRLARNRAIENVIGELPRHILEAVLLGGIILIVLVKMFFSDGDLGKTLPIIGLYAFAGLRLFPAAQNIYRNITAMRFAKAALENLYRDLNDLGAETSKVPDQVPAKAETIRLHRQLELRDVKFSYPQADRQTLNGISMTIAANTTVGLVGQTGAGKTTIVDLFLGLLMAKEGGLYVDDHLIDSSNARKWQQWISYVPQQIFLADDTVTANIAYGIAANKVDMEAVFRAAQSAKLHDFVVNELPKGYDTQVGERGIRLSGGQSQRIVIARALYNDPDLLILDEATSALDNLTERAVMDAVQSLGKTKTIIVVAHRLSTIQACDNIFLINDGTVEASGTYSELVESSEKFRTMAGGLK